MVLLPRHFLALGMGLLLSGSAAAQAEKWSAQWSAYAPATRTQLVDIGLNPGFARQLQPIRAGGFESAQGAWVGFQAWYAPAWRDTRATWLTPLNRNFGVLWGLSTGESAPKYRVAPGLHLGAVYQSEIARDVSVSFKAMHVLGGRLKERTCQADYGVVGGNQEVNCRLAASVLAPSETLKLMLNGRPDNATELQIRLNYRF